MLAAEDPNSLVMCTACYEMEMREEHAYEHAVAKFESIPWLARLEHPVPRGGIGLDL